MPHIMDITCQKKTIYITPFAIIRSKNYKVDSKITKNYKVKIIFVTFKLLIIKCLGNELQTLQKKTILHCK